MKLFHALDTKIFQKKYKEYCDLYWSENIYAFRKSVLFLRLKVVPRFIFLVLSTALLIYLFMSIFQKGGGLRYVVGVVICVLMSILGNVSVIKRYLDYKCDFTLVTPREIIISDQRWLLNRTMKSLSREKINSITTERAGFLQNIYNVGTLVIRTEWSVTAITIKYVSQPDSKRQHMMSIMEKVN